MNCNLIIKNKYFYCRTNSCKRKLPFNISNIEKGIEVDQNLPVTISESHLGLVSEQSTRLMFILIN